MRSALAIAMMLGACGFEARNHALDDAAPGPTDAKLDTFIPDAGPCQSLISTCVGNGERLRACKAVGMVPEETVCSWGCVEAPQPHCQRLMPAGGSLQEADVDPANNANLVAKTLAADGGMATINTDNGEIRGGNGAVLRAPGTGVIDGIDYQMRGNAGMFRFAELTLIGPNTFTVTGTRALALVSLTKITVTQRGGLNLQGTCMGTAAGPGGNIGGNAAMAGNGQGAGGAGGTAGGTCSGGGGGGNGEAGGDGGNTSGSIGGMAFSSAPIALLVGGGGGGGGGGATGGRGGGGGGAVQIVANDVISFAGEVVNLIDARYVTINAGGCGGEAGPANQCGGGGGAGGTILIEASRIQMNWTVLAANGGGGAGASSGGDGDNAALSTQAAGGASGNPPGMGQDRGGAGGNGGRGNQFRNDDQAGAGAVTDSRGGGGGGGAGRIRLNTRDGSVVESNSLVTPTMNESQAATRGSVSVH